jgi:hypothetical protein
MLELTGFDVVLRGVGVLYWLLAIGALSLAIWKGATPSKKIIWGTIAVVAFGSWPAKLLIEDSQRQAYAREAWAYFKKKCETEAGEKIYKTFTGVKSVLVIKPLPPATEKDLYDQFWYGDPYSAVAHSQRGKYETAILASPNAPVSFGQAGRGLDFIESIDVGGEKEKKSFVKYSYVDGKQDQRPIDKPISRFAISWDDISTPADRKWWVAGSRLRIIDLRNNSVVAERIGFLIEPGFGSTTGTRRPWLAARGPTTTCPQIVNGDFEDRWFILKVVNPTENAGHGQ